MISQEELNASNLQTKIAQQQAQLESLVAQAEAERKAAAEKAAAEAEAARLAEQKAAEEAAKKEAASAGSGTSSQVSSGNTTSGSSAGESVSNSSTSSTAGKYLGRFKLTAYCACSKCCGQWSNGITASGTTATQGRTVAMAGVPFGKQVLINGKIYIVEDRGTPYGHVDVFFSSHSAALGFGLQYADVYQLN